MVLRRLYSQQHLWQRIKELERLYTRALHLVRRDDKRTLDRLSVWCLRAERVAMSRTESQRA